MESLYICTDILTEHTNVPCILTNYKSVDNESESSSNYVSSKKKKEAFFALCDKISNPFRRDDDAFFLNTYLTRIDEVKLHLRMSQLPILVRETPIIKSNFDGKKKKLEFMY